MSMRVVSNAVWVLAAVAVSPAEAHHSYAIYLAEPVTGRIAWDYAPDQKLLPSARDAETARRFLLTR